MLHYPVSNKDLGTSEYDDKLLRKYFTSDFAHRRKYYNEYFKSDCFTKFLQFLSINFRTKVYVADQTKLVKKNNLR